MTKAITVTPQDIEMIKIIVKENNVDSAFKLIYDNSSGIGSTLDMEFDVVLHGREATIRIPINGVENW